MANSTFKLAPLTINSSPAVVGQNQNQTQQKALSSSILTQPNSSIAMQSSPQISIPVDAIHQPPMLSNVLQSSSHFQGFPGSSDRQPNNNGQPTSSVGAPVAANHSRSIYDPFYPLIAPINPSSDQPVPKKRTRRKYDEIERNYKCSWPGCTKAYGTLNHLNAHIVMQQHGQKRSPEEFREMRKKWKQQKEEERKRKEEECIRNNNQYHFSTNSLCRPVSYSELPYSGQFYNQTGHQQQIMNMSLNTPAQFTQQSQLHFPVHSNLNSVAAPLQHVIQSNPNGAVPSPAAAALQHLTISNERVQPSSNNQLQRINFPAPLPTPDITPAASPKINLHTESVVPQMKQNNSLMNAAMDQKFLSSIQDSTSFQQQSVVYQAPMNTSQNINLGTLPSPSSAMSNPSVLYDQRSYTMNPYNRYNDPNTNGPYFGVQNIYTNTSQNNGIGRESTANDTMNRIMNIAEYKPY